MAAISLSIPDNLLTEAIEAQAIWEADAKRMEPDYDSLTDSEKLEALLLASCRVRIRNKRREAAERALNVPEPNISRRRR